MHRPLRGSRLHPNRSTGRIDTELIGGSEDPRMVSVSLDASAARAEDPAPTAAETAYTRFRPVALYSCSFGWAVVSAKCPCRNRHRCNGGIPQPVGSTVRCRSRHGGEVEGQHSVAVRIVTKSLDRVSVIAVRSNACALITKAADTGLRAVALYSYAFGTVIRAENTCRAGAYRPAETPVPCTPSPAGGLIESFLPKTVLPLASFV